MTAADLCEAKAEIADDDRHDAVLRSSEELFRHFIAFIFLEYYDIEECNGNDAHQFLDQTIVWYHQTKKIFRIHSA